MWTDSATLCDQKTFKSFMIVSRDYSWVFFNERVLQEAADKENPLYERIKFLAIFSSNLDEFYRVRVAKLRHYKTLRKSLRPKVVERPSEHIRRINKVVVQQQKRFGYIYRTDIIPELESEGVFIKREGAFSGREIRALKALYDSKVKDGVELYYLDERIPFLEDKALYLFGFDDDRPVLITIPDTISRFIVLKSDESTLSLTYLEELFREFKSLYLDQPSEQWYSIKLSRDPELYIDEDDISEELVDQIRNNLQLRTKGLPTRLLYDTDMPVWQLDYLKLKFDLNETDLMPGGRYHNMHDLFSFPQPKDKEHLSNQPKPPLPHPELDEQSNILSYVKENEVLLSVPYQSFDYVERLIQEAADNEDVMSISITLYRISKESKIAKALLTALKGGKKVTVFIEAKARFDEANNIYWGKQLKEAGATVLYSMPHIKVHSKIMLIESRNGSVSYVGTGNFNEKNAKLYTDFFYITPREDVASDLNKIFAYLCGQQSVPEVESIWLSPWNTRDKIMACIDREIKANENGQTSGVFLKMNGLEDPIVIKKLCEASDSGVPVRLIVRGICCFAPGNSGPGKDIQIRSIVDRFLEHPRIYWFCNDEKETIYLTSADCMVRNLDKRIEVGVEIYAPKLKKIIQDYMEIQWSDNVKARIIKADLKNKLHRDEGPIIRSQLEIYEYFRKMVQPDI